MGRAPAGVRGCGGSCPGAPGPDRRAGRLPVPPAPRDVPQAQLTTVVKFKMNLAHYAVVMSWYQLSDAQEVAFPGFDAVEGDA